MSSSNIYSHKSLSISLSPDIDAVHSLNKTIQGIFYISILQRALIVYRALKQTGQPWHYQVEESLRQSCSSKVCWILCLVHDSTITGEFKSKKDACLRGFSVASLSSFVDMNELGSSPYQWLARFIRRHWSDAPPRSDGWSIRGLEGVLWHKHRQHGEENKSLTASCCADLIQTRIKSVPRLNLSVHLCWS